MKCHYCEQGETRVVDTRERQEKIKRRRECKNCGKRFTTYETVESIDTKVEKQGGDIEKFDEDKIRSGLKKAVQKTPVTSEDIEKIIEKVKSQIKQKEKVSSKQIGEIVKKELRSRNKVAYIRFASVYDSFDDVEMFQKEVEALKE